MKMYIFISDKILPPRTVRLLLLSKCTETFRDDKSGLIQLCLYYICVRICRVERIHLYNMVIFI